MMLPDEEDGKMQHRADHGKKQVMVNVFQHVKLLRP
jgi:hypothetical protein